MGEKGPQKKKINERKEKTYSISRSPRRSSPFLPPPPPPSSLFSLDASISAFLSSLSSFFSIILLRSELCAIYPSPSSSLARSLATRRDCERATERGRRARSVSTWRRGSRLGGSARGDRASQEERGLFSQKRALGAVSAAVGLPNKFHSEPRPLARGVRGSLPSSRLRLPVSLPSPPPLPPLPSRRGRDAHTSGTRVAIKRVNDISACRFGRTM